MDMADIWFNGMEAFKQIYNILSTEGLIWWKLLKEDLEKKTLNNYTRVLSVLPYMNVAASLINGPWPFVQIFNPTL